MLSELKFLDFRGNKIEIIPNEILNMKNLTHLYLSKNPIKVYPDELKKMSNLKVIEIWNPDKIGEVKKNDLDTNLNKHLIEDNNISTNTGTYNKINEEEEMNWEKNEQSATFKSDEIIIWDDTVYVIKNLVQKKIFNSDNITYSDSTYEVSVLYIAKNNEKIKIDESDWDINFIKFKDNFVLYEWSSTWGDILKVYDEIFTENGSEIPRTCHILITKLCV